MYWIKMADWAGKITVCECHQRRSLNRKWTRAMLDTGIKSIHVFEGDSQRQQFKYGILKMPSFGDAVAHLKGKAVAYDNLPSANCYAPDGRMLGLKRKAGRSTWYLNGKRVAYARLIEIAKLQAS